MDRRRRNRDRVASAGIAIGLYFIYNQDVTTIGEPWHVIAIRLAGATLCIMFILALRRSSDTIYEAMNGIAEDVQDSHRREE